jgi:hypothetical protein
MTAVCPTDVVEAPIDVVWRLLTEPAGWGGFFDVRIIRIVPPGSARVGQRVFAESGPRLFHFKVRFEFTAVDAERHRLGLQVRLPFGVTVREDLHCAAVSESRCRVTYGCDFGFVDGWRGWIGKLLLGREMATGPADSLARLKAAAERAADPKTGTRVTGSFQGH